MICDDCINRVRDVFELFYNPDTDKFEYCPRCLWYSAREKRNVYIKEIPNYCEGYKEGGQL